MCVCVRVCARACVCVCVCVSLERGRTKYTGNTALPAAKVAVFGRQILEVGVRRCVGVRVVMLGVWQGDGKQGVVMGCAGMAES